MYKGKKGKYVTAGVQKTPSMPFGVAATVHLPDSEVGAAWYDPNQKPFYAETVMKQKRGPRTMMLNTALILLCALFVVFGVMTLTRTVRKAALAKDISAMEQAILELQRENADLALQVAQARDLARISYDAVNRLQMVASGEADTIAIHAPDTRPFGDSGPAASAGVKTGNRQ